MPQLNYSIKFNKSPLPLSASDIVDQYFFGIPIIDQSGNSMDEDKLNFYIESAVADVEGILNLKLSKQIVEENLSYFNSDYKSWGYIPTSFPVLEALSMTGFLGNIEQIAFPKDWLSIKKTTDPTGVHRSIQLVPTAGAAQHSSVVYSGITPHLGWFGQKTIPNYWTVRYCTSFEKIPSDILDVVGKLAAINIFHQLGDIILGAGIASQSIGIDGLSQSISTTSSATNAGYGARVTGYLSDLKLAVPKLRAKYNSITLSVL